MMKIQTKLGRGGFSNCKNLLLVIRDFIIDYTMITCIGVRNILLKMNTMNLTTLNLSRFLSMQATIRTLEIEELKF